MAGHQDLGSGLSGRRVAVIGGGWAGIAAAVELTAAGAAVTLFEAGRVLGGRARVVNVGGRRLDNGQHILLGAYRETLALMRRVGADPDRLLARHPLRIVDNAGFRLALPRLPAPLNLVGGLLAARGVGWREKWRTARWMQNLKRQGFRLADDDSVAAWLDTAGQSGRLRRHLWQPLCLAALNTPAEEASAQLFANVLRDSLGSARRGDTDLLLPRCDLGRLLAEPAGDWLLAHGVTLRRRTRVRALHAGGEAVAIDGEQYAAAIIATAPQHAGRLWPALAGNLEY
ncbi:MAG: hydroxysqualene dehydroxylase HpnE, partial [Betaproteobacteria bacterium]|nr:hydroxysqualene dehydroxylase HpnE [Betaproteobacteria bacterium]